MSLLKSRSLLLLSLVGLVSIAAVYWVALERSHNRLTGQGSAAAALYVQVIRAEIDRRRHLPEVLSADRDIVAVTAGADAVEVNRRLERLALATEVEAIYLMNAAGLTVAASNWREPDTFLGQNYGFREYFRNAVRGEVHREFAIGATTGRPGLFISHPVRGAGGAVDGVIVVKVDLGTFSEFWKAQGHEVLLINPDGIVVDAGRSAWQFRSTRQLSAAQRERIDRQKQFADRELSLLDLSIEDDGSMRLEGVAYYRVEAPIEWLEWDLWLLVPQQYLRQDALVAVTYAGLIVLFVITSLSLVRSARFRTALRSSQQESDTLKRLNEELEREIEERRQAQAELQNAQARLRQSAKLTALGQLAASITHELGQPLSAMKTYIRGAQRELERGTEVKPETVNRLDRLVDRIGNITRQLKFFTRRGGEPLRPLDLRTAVEGAAEIVGPRADESGVRLDLELPAHEIPIDGGQQRLEQVLVNLIGNAIDSLDEQPEPRIRVVAEIIDGRARLCVSDNGAGISPEIEDTLFEPFTTTRASGDGTGLGLAISASIVEEHGGALSARNRDAGGAEFVITLPLRAEEKRAVG